MQYIRRTKMAGPRRLIMSKVMRARVYVVWRIRDVSTDMLSNLAAD